MKVAELQQLPACNSTDARAIALTNEAFQVSKRTRALYREIQRVHHRLGTSKEKPGDLDRILRQVQVMTDALTATALYRKLVAESDDIRSLVPVLS